MKTESEVYREPGVGIVRRRVRKAYASGAVRYDYDAYRGGSSVMRGFRSQSQAVRYLLILAAGKGAR